MKTSCKEARVHCQALERWWYGRLTSWVWFPGFVFALRISWCIRRHAMRTDVHFQGRCHQSLGTCEDLTIEHVFIINAFSKRTRWQGVDVTQCFSQHPSIFYWHSKGSGLEVSPSEVAGSNFVSWIWKAQGTIWSALLEAKQMSLLKGFHISIIPVDFPGWGKGFATRPLHSSPALGLD